ncbi:MAG TPA: NHL repeat-containing protein, partial [Bryobacteraceae bacterium]|nr:NHL repeat-containing protein [Bryobacteraceae bacterium]
MGQTLRPASVLLLATLAHAQNIFTVVGIPYSHRDSVDTQPGLSAPLGSVYGVLIDKVTGRLLFNDELLVLRLEPDSSLLTVAGMGLRWIPPQLAGLASPSSIPASFLEPVVLRGMAQDSAGALYLSDADAGRVYRVGTDGTVTTFAGGGAESPGDGGPAAAAVLESPRGLVFDSKGNLDIAEVFCNCIRQVTPAAIIYTLYTAPPPPAPILIRNLEGLAIDAHDNLYFTEWYGHVVVKVSPDGSATSIAGTGSPGFSGDGGPANAAQLDGPSGVTLDADGNIYIADTLNNRIRKVGTDGTITTIAGTGPCGIQGDGGPALAAELCEPAETVLDASGDLLIADYRNRRVREIASDGNIATIAGSGKLDPHLSAPGSSGDGGPEIHATFVQIGGAAFDPAGNLYVSDFLGFNIRKIASDGAVSTIAGTGQNGYSGDGGPALQAQLVYPGPVSVGPDGAVYVITGDSRVRKITPDGNIHLVAGTGTGSGLIRDQGDGGPAVDATLNEPGAVAFDQHGDIYIADTSNARIRKIDADGIITTVGQIGQQGVDYYNSVALDPQGNLYVAWTHALPTAIYSTVNRVNPDGSFTRVAGIGQPCSGSGQFTDDGVPALQAHLCAVTSMTTGPDGLLYLSEGYYSLVLRLASDGTIQRVAGDTAAINSGDGGPALQANLRGGVGFSPGAVTFDPSGKMYFPEAGLNIIRQVTTTPYQPALSPDHIDAAGPLTQTLAV